MLNSKINLNLFFDGMLKMNIWHYLLILSIIIIVIGAILTYYGYSSNGIWTIGAGIALLVAFLIIIFIEHAFRVNESANQDSQLLKGSLEAVPPIPIN